MTFPLILEICSGSFGVRFFWPTSGDAQLGLKPGWLHSLEFWINSAPPLLWAFLPHPSSLNQGVPGFRAVLKGGSRGIQGLIMMPSYKPPGPNHGPHIQEKANHTSPSSVLASFLQAAQMCMEPHQSKYESPPFLGTSGVEHYQNIAFWEHIKCQGHFLEKSVRFIFMHTRQHHTRQIPALWHPMQMLPLISISFTCWQKLLLRNIKYLFRKLGNKQSDWENKNPCNI